MTNCNNGAGVKLNGVHDDNNILNGDSKSPKIVIIGAGIAGLSAAHRLAENGFEDIVILEASDRIGGRIWTIELETAPGRKAEMGANWIHGIDANPIYRLCRERGLLDHPSSGGVLGHHPRARSLATKPLFVTDDGESVSPKVVQEIDLVYGQMLAQCQDYFQDEDDPPPLLTGEDSLALASLGRHVAAGVLKKVGHFRGPQLEIRKQLLEHRMLWETIVAGAPHLDAVSLVEYGSATAIPGVHYTIPNGFESVLGLLVAGLPPSSILLNHAAIGVEWGTGSPDSTGSSVVITTANGKKFKADHALITLSLGCLKNNARQLFTPSLGKKKLDAIGALAIGTVDKIVLEFEGQVFPDEVVRLEMIWNRNGLALQDVAEAWPKKICFFEAIEKNVLIGWLCGREAEYVETLPEEVVGKKCVEILGMFLKNYVQDIPPIKRVIVSRWKSNPYTAGSYTYIPVGARAEDIGTLAEPLCNDNGTPVVMFAGEATHPSFYSSSHGALLTGQREADRVIGIYRPKLNHPDL